MFSCVQLWFSILLMTEKPKDPEKNDSTDAATMKEALPSSIPEIVADQSTLRNIYDRAKTEWQKVYHHSELMTRLREYLALTPEKRKDATELKKYLRYVRKHDQTLKSACYFCNSEQKLPTSLELCIRYLGKAVDAYSMKKGNKYAERVLEIMEQSELVVEESQTVQLEDYYQRLSVLVDKIRKYLLPKKITVEQYHTLRKDLRSIKNLCFLVSGQEGCDQRIIQISGYLDRLNSELGKIHDEYVSKELKEKVDYHQTSMKIGAQLKVRIQRFLELLQAKNVRQTQAIEQG